MGLDRSQSPNRMGRERLRRDPNHIPAHVGTAFQSELIELVDKLAETGDPKARYLQGELTSKYLDEEIVPAELRAQAAIQKWLLAEANNAKTNQRLYLANAWPNDFNHCDSEGIFSFVRSVVKRVLGPLNYPDVLSGSSHTNGASTRIRRGVIAAAEKCTGTAHVSSSALPHWTRIVENTRLEDQTVALQEASVLFTVPKKTEIDRVACKEPEINMFLQRAVGLHIRKRLRKHGIDLNDQTVNQRLARSAVSDGLATIDLQSASDSITHQLVINCLPFDWYSLLDDIRVKETILPDGTIHSLEMFSSMGNGFTFELESLLFWAFTRAVCSKLKVKGRISVYGDDIIMPSVAAPFFATIFGWFGFKVNSKKSNWKGLFRESCGKHYLGDWDVSPFYIREAVRRKVDIIRLLNHLLNWDGRGFGFFTTQSVAAFHYKWSQVIPQALWGGICPERDESLVTGHSPRSRLLRKPKSLATNESGALEHWFVSRERMEQSRLSWDTTGDPWSYPFRETTVGRVRGISELPSSSFTVSRTELGTYFVSPCKTFGSAPHSERTTWVPYLIWDTTQYVPTP